MKHIFTISMLFAASFAGAAQVQYTYDAAGRLTGVDYGAAGSIAYTYDAAGNVTSRVVQPSQSASIVTAGRLSADGSIRLAGTNLIPHDVAALSVSVNGEQAQVIETCSASVNRRCRSDQIVVVLPSRVVDAKLEIAIYHSGARVASSILPVLQRSLDATVRNQP